MKRIKREDWPIKRDVPVYWEPEPIMTTSNFIYLVERVNALISEVTQLQDTVTVQRLRLNALARKSKS